MAPARTRKAKASPSDTASTRSRIVAMKSPVRTPIASPSKGVTAMGITASQKQALIDNLQLEVTERARKLRAQYALQAQSLRTRIEMRINRIPSGLRKMKMGDLYEKHLQMDAAAKSQAAGVSKQGKQEAGQQVTTAIQQESFSSRNEVAKAIIPNTTISTTAPTSRGTKRTSDVFDSDKENPTTSTTTSTGPKPIPNKKQRVTTKDSSHPSHQNPNPSTILSPKSANSRTLPSHHSKGGDPLQKSQYTIRPTSPLKAQTSPVRTKATATGGGATKSAASTLAKTMGPPPQPQANKPRGRKAAGKPAVATAVEIHDEGSIRTVSSASNASTGTTIIKKPTAKATKGGEAKISKTTAGKKTAAAATTTAAEEKTGTKGGRRVLRKR